MGGERDSPVAGGGVAEEDDNSSSQREKLPTSFRNMGDLSSWLELEKGCQFSCDAFEMEVNGRQRRNAYAQVLRSYDELGPRIDNLDDAKNIILRYTPGTWTEKVGGMKLCDFDVPKITTLLLVGPKGSGKSSLINRISKVFDGNFSSERAQVSYNSSIEDGTYFLQEYMIPRSSSSFCLYDTRSFSNDSSGTMKILEHWMTKGVRHGELVMRDSDNYDLKTRIKCKAPQSDSVPSETRVVNFVIFVVNGMSILKSIVCQSRQSETDDETKACYTQLVAEMFNSPFLSFRDDKPVVVVTHGDLLSLSDRALVRVHLGELLGVPPKTQIFDITESCDPATELTIVDMLRYSLEHADRNLPGKGLQTSKVSVLSIPSRMRTLRLVVLGMVMINLVAQFHDATSEVEGDGTESNFLGLVSPSALGSKDKPTELNREKSSTSRGKKKKKEMLQKVDAQGTTSDLYMAYKGPEEKREAAASLESTESSSSITWKQVSVDASDGNVLSNEKCANNKPTPDHWENAADISTPKLDALLDGKKASKELKLHGNDEIEGMTKIYSRDFLLKFSGQCNELPEAFKIQSEIAEALISSNVNFPQKSYPSSGRVVDRPASGPRLERYPRLSYLGEEDKWSKMPGPLAQGLDLRLDVGYVGNLQGFRPGPGGNSGVLRNPLVQKPVQHVGSILSGPMHSTGPQGGMQRNKKELLQMLQKAETKGTTSDLYMAYKGPEEKREAPASLESTESSSCITLKQVSVDASDGDVLSNEKCANYNPEPDDWENAADIPTPKLDILHDGKKVSQESKLHGNDEIERMIKKYSRDFLLKFLEQCNELPEDFKIQSEIAEALISSNLNFPQKSYPSSGRVVDRLALGPQLERYLLASFLGEEDKWSKMPGPLAQGRDLRLDIGYAGNLQGFRPGLGRNYGVLRDPRVQTPIQHVRSILSGPMQSPGPQGGMQPNKKEMLQKLDAQGTTSDLYRAYKGPEEKREAATSLESTVSSCSITWKQVSADASEGNVLSNEKCANRKPEPDDWENAADISTPKLDALLDGKKASQELKLHGNDEIEGMTKKYSRDFLLKFSEQCNELPEAFKIQSEIAEALISSNVNFPQKSYPSSGRVVDRPASGPGLERYPRVSFQGEEDKWRKMPGRLVQGCDLRLDVGYVGNLQSFRPGPGGNYGVLRNPRAQTPVQHVRSILSGTMQSPGPQGGMQPNKKEMLQINFI